jgi:hypothetical protein
MSLMREMIADGTGMATAMLDAPIAPAQASVRHCDPPTAPRLPVEFVSQSIDMRRLVASNWSTWR